MKTPPTRLTEQHSNRQSLSCDSSLRYWGVEGIKGASSTMQETLSHNHGQNRSFRRDETADGTQKSGVVVWGTFRSDRPISEFGFSAQTASINGPSSGV